MKLSIIIPVYNESATIKDLLQYLLASVSNPKDCEIIVADGGSVDTSVEIAKAIKGVTVVTSPKGRGAQMNYGAQMAKAKTLYFLHADSFPPKNFDQLILNKIKEGHRAGCFRMQFDRKHWWLFLAGWFTQFNLKFFRGGDQSLYIDKKLFNKLGMYPTAFPIFEDYELIRKLYDNNSFVVIQYPIVSSSRRYTENGIAKLQYHYWMIYIKKWLGASAEELLYYYKKHVK